MSGTAKVLLASLVVVAVWFGLMYVSLCAFAEEVG